MSVASLAIKGMPTVHKLQPWTVRNCKGLRFDPTVRKTFGSEAQEFITHPWHSKQLEQHWICACPQVPQE